MLHLFKEMRVLREEGKLHKRLLARTRILFFISLALLVIVLYNIFLNGTDAFFAGVLAFVGFLLGLFLFSRMTGPMRWNEEAEVIETGRMDIVGYVTIGLYILFEIGLRTFLKDISPASETALLLAGVFGALFGRVIGTMLEIHRVYLASHAAEA